MRNMRKIALVLGFSTALMTVGTTAATSTFPRLGIASHTYPNRLQEHAVLSSVYLSALSLAYQDWLRNVSAGKYAIANQTIQVTRAGKDIWVRFVPRDDNPRTFGGETRFGKETLYIIDRSGRRIIQRLFAE